MYRMFENIKLLVAACTTLICSTTSLLKTIALVHLLLIFLGWNTISRFKIMLARYCSRWKLLDSLLAGILGNTLISLMKKMVLVFQNQKCCLKQNERSEFTPPKIANLHNLIPFYRLLETPSLVYSPIHCCWIAKTCYSNASLCFEQEFLRFFFKVYLCHYIIYMLYNQIYWFIYYFLSSFCAKLSFFVYDG